MGKCSGLKAGGHHRKALDVAEKKRKEKENRKKEQELAGKRAIVLQEILSNLDPDCDIYLDSKDNNAPIPELCRAHFRFEDCSKRRCKFSHEHSIAEALGNVISGSSSGNGRGKGRGRAEDSEDGNGNSSSPTIPGLQLVPGILVERGNASRRRREQRWKQRPLPSPSDDASDSQQQSQSHFEIALSEGSSAVNKIVTYLESNTDVLHLALSCRHLHNVILIGDGKGCRDVQRRKYRAKEFQLQKRNKALLKDKSVGGRFRYAVSYTESNAHVNNFVKGKNRRNKTKGDNNKSNIRPILVYDYENPHVFRAFQESGIKLNVDKFSAAFSSDCKLER
mmetsp:Transcript_24266/g.67206  ORF Transcript_24266/g.67206 Transcript_24266/m.67206 type:complete len:336 (-) Transcript_24266:224-1231(-)|eukprot:CAMPEP_0172368724 /NCGR_PEP_ID=MMETSP1060-20121228/28976_1 /TAXON_ID=37318 /ORGANISM="Pseudo-nitzschia pungens, Strain cf. cingulata" /LENGTH=335 /DNA_ID=CAMNT_0013093413 /DNA_START=87 /DNA_END=1094 /DNA_ORIENTATION=+